MRYVIPALIVVFIVCSVVAYNYVSDVIEKNKASYKPYTVSSDNYKTKDSKIQRLQEERIAIYSKVDDLLFVINVKPSSIGPTLRERFIAIKMAPVDIRKWIDGYELTTYYEDWHRTFSVLKIDWKISSAPKYYCSTYQMTLIAVFEDEGIILIYSHN